MLELSRSSGAGYETCAELDLSEVSFVVDVAYSSFVFSDEDTEDGMGKEVISRFSTDIASDGIMYTDSNGRDMQVSSPHRSFGPFVFIIFNVSTQKAQMLISAL